MTESKKVRYNPRLWRMPDGKSDKPRRAKNVKEFSYAEGHSFCGYRASVQIRGVVRERYFSAKKLGWDVAFMEAVAQAEVWRRLR